MCSGRNVCSMLQRKRTIKAAIPKKSNNLRMDEIPGEGFFFTSVMVALTVIESPPETTETKTQVRFEFGTNLD